jgi:hypothetical protein
MLLDAIHRRTSARMHVSTRLTPRHGRLVCLTQSDFLQNLAAFNWICPPITRLLSILCKPTWSRPMERCGERYDTQAKIVEVLEKPNRARPSPRRVHGQCEAWFQTLSESGLMISGIEPMRRIRRPVQSNRHAPQKYQSACCLQSPTRSCVANNESDWRDKQGIWPDISQVSTA